jgi:hypothetical protein
MVAMEDLCCWENETIERGLKIVSENKVILWTKSQDIFLIKEGYPFEALTKAR